MIMETRGGKLLNIANTLCIEAERWRYVAFYIYTVSCARRSRNLLDTSFINVQWLAENMWSCGRKAGSNNTFSHFNINMVSPRVLKLAECRVTEHSISVDMMFHCNPAILSAPHHPCTGCAVFRGFAFEFCRMQRWRGRPNLGRENWNQSNILPFNLGPRPPLASTRHANDVWRTI